MPRKLLLLSVLIGTALNLPAAEPPAVTGEVIARLAGQPITVAEVEAFAQEKVFEARQALFEARQSGLEAWLEARLLALEAKHRGLSIEALEQAEIDAKLPKLDASILRVLLKTVNESEEPDPETLAKFLQQFEQTARQLRRTELVAELKGRYPLESLQAPPTTPLALREPVEGERGPWLGAQEPKVRLVVFSGYDCPFCRRHNSLLHELLKAYPGTLQVELRHTPLDEEGDGLTAAQAAYCADRQGKFWAYNDALFADWDQSEAGLRTLAEKQGLNLKTWEACLKSSETQRRVAADIAEGKRLGMSGLPVTFVNGIRVEGAKGKEPFVKLIEAEVGAAVGEQPVAGASANPWLGRWRTAGGSEFRAESGADGQMLWVYTKPNAGAVKGGAMPGTILAELTLKEGRLVGRSKSFSTSGECRPLWSDTRVKAESDGSLRVESNQASCENHQWVNVKPETLVFQRVAGS